MWSLCPWRRIWLEWSVWLVDFCEGTLDPPPHQRQKKNLQTKPKSNLLQTSRDQSMQVKKKNKTQVSSGGEDASHSPVDTG